MTAVTIIGPGNMGRAIASVVSKGGNEVQMLGRRDANTPVNGDIIVLAVNYAELDQIIADRGDQLAGKVVVDISNPVDPNTFDGLVVPADGSAALELSGKLPRSTVLKAFNTTFAATLAAGTVGPLTTTVLVAGDDQTAKQALMAVITAGGLKAIDAGSLKRAREMEAIGFLQISLAASEKISWTGGFGIVP